MDIAALSMALSQTQVMQQASVSVAKKAMNVTETQMQGLMDMIPQAVPPSSHTLDIRA